MKWIDTHCHVCSLESDGSKRPGFARHLLEVLDRDPSELHMVICPDSIWFSRIQTDPEGMQAAAQEIRDIVQLAPDCFHGALMPNPHFPDASLRLMDLCFGEWGFVMLGEMMQYSMSFRLTDPGCLRLLRHAAELGVPIMSHVATLDVKQGAMTGTGQLLDLLEAAIQVPDARFILGHFVGMAETDPTWADRYIDIVEACFGCWPRNFWAEIRDFGSPGLRSAVRRIPLDRLVSGTDWTTRGTPPFSPFGSLFDCMMNRVPEPYDEPPSTRQLAGFLEKEGLTEDRIAAIASDNAAVLLGLPSAVELGALRPTAAESAMKVEPRAFDWDPAEACSVYVIYVPVGMTETELLRHFQVHGLAAEKAEIARDCHTGRTWGYAIVRMCDAASAQRAVHLPAEELRTLGMRPVYLTRR